MLVIDTDTLERRDRADAMTAALADATGATSLSHEGSASAAYLRMDQWRLGAATLVRAACSGHTQSRTSRRPARDEEPVVVIGLQHRGGGAQVQDEAVVPLAPGAVYAMVLSGSFRHISTGHTRTSNLLIRASDLELPVQLISQARPRITTSPVTRLVRSHVWSLATAVDDLDASSMDAVAAATLELARALVASASGSPPHVQDALTETLVARVRAYVMDHLCDRNLTPASIAAAHHVSIRQLYKACAAEQLRLEPWIIARRLDAAHDELGRLGNRRPTIAAVAAKWGFANSSHFSHRFREAYGMTPREWQHHGRDGGAPNALAHPAS